MKKLLLLILFVLLLAGCNNSAPINDGKTDDETTKPGSNLQNSSINTKSEVIERISYYVSRIVGEGEEGLEGESYHPVFLSDTATTVYTRDDFNDYYNYVNPVHDMTEELIITTTTLNELKDVLELCEDFNEDIFCDVEDGEVLHRIKSYIENGTLYIESYQNTSLTDGNQTINTTRTNIFFFDEISDKVHAETLREVHEYRDNSVSHRYYYDEYNEDGIQINIAIDDWSFSYRKYDLSSYENFRIQKDSNFYGVEFYDTSSDVQYTIYRNPDDTIRFQSLKFFNGVHYMPVIGYKHSNINSGSETLGICILDYTGWDSIAVDEQNNAKLYQGETELLSEHEFYFNSNTSRVSFGHETTQEDITEEMVTLANHGLSTDLFTYDDFLAGMQVINGDMTDILSQNNFSTTFDDNRQIIIDLFPFRADTTIISEMEAFFTTETE